MVIFYSFTLLKFCLILFISQPVPVLIQAFSKVTFISVGFTVAHNTLENHFQANNDSFAQTCQ